MLQLLIFPALWVLWLFFLKAAWLSGLLDTFNYRAILLSCHAANPRRCQISTPETGCEVGEFMHLEILPISLQRLAQLGGWFLFARCLALQGGFCLCGILRNTACEHYMLWALFLRLILKNYFIDLKLDTSLLCSRGSKPRAVGQRTPFM